MKLRVLVTIAYFRNELSDITDEIKKEIRIEFDEGNKWTKRPELLRLFANTMPLWSQDKLDFWIRRLLARAKSESVTELMLERYLRIFENYLVTCYERKSIKKVSNNKCIIDEIINYIIGATSTTHLMIYRINAIYMKALFKNDRKKTAKIRKDMNIYGYGEMITNWPD